MQSNVRARARPSIRWDTSPLNERNLKKTFRVNVKVSQDSGAVKNAVLDRGEVISGSVPLPRSIHEAKYNS